MFFVQMKANPRAGIFPGVFFSPGETSRRSAENKAFFTARIIFVQLSGREKTKLQQHFQIAAMSPSDLLRTGDFRLLAQAVALSRNAARVGMCSKAWQQNEALPGELV